MAKTVPSFSPAENCDLRKLETSFASSQIGGDDEFSIFEPTDQQFNVNKHKFPGSGLTQLQKHQKSSSMNQTTGDLRQVSDSLMDTVSDQFLYD
jgi:hypothetical protein